MRKNHGWAAFWQKKQYIIAGTLVILAAVGMTVLYSRGQEQERKQLEQEIAAEMDTENQDVALEEETEADQVASILKPQTQSTETAEVEKESEEADSGRGRGITDRKHFPGTSFRCGRWHFMADGRKCDLRLQHGLDGVFCDVRPVQNTIRRSSLPGMSTAKFMRLQKEKSRVLRQMK